MADKDTFEFVVSGAQIDSIRSQFIAAIDHERAANERNNEWSAQFDRGYQSGMKYVMETFGLTLKDL
jgi:predicted secreted protein